jgi:hypothetical protein
MPPLSWLRILDLLLGVIDLRRARRGASSDRASRRRYQYLEGRVAGVVAGALDDVFARDRRRQAEEAERREAERREAERAARLALIRQAGDREIGRLRLVAALALVGWLGSLFVAAMLSGAGPRVVVATGWLFLLAAMTSALVAQAGLANALARVTDPDRRPPDSGLAGLAAAWLLVLGLALVAIGALTI